jgi:hypothetical protein
MEDAMHRRLVRLLALTLLVLGSWLLGPNLLACPSDWPVDDDSADDDDDDAGDDDSAG